MPSAPDLAHPALRRAWRSAGNDRGEVPRRGAPCRSRAPARAWRGPRARARTRARARCPANGRPASASTTRPRCARPPLRAAGRAGPRRTAPGRGCPRPARRARVRGAAGPPSGARSEGWKPASGERDAEVLATTRTSGDAGSPRSRCRLAASRSAARRCWSAAGMRWISSRKRVPRSARSSWPRAAAAPDPAAPAARLEARAWPAARRAQFTWMNGWRERAEAWWMARATASCPARAAP